MKLQAGLCAPVIDPVVTVNREQGRAATGRGGCWSRPGQATPGHVAAAAPCLEFCYGWFDGFVRKDFLAMCLVAGRILVIFRY